jgi:hypothetical protein
MFFMAISVGKTQVFFDGRILSAILQSFTRYSANVPQFPVNDWSPFTGKSHVIGAMPRRNGRPMKMGRREARLDAGAPG